MFRIWSILQKGVFKKVGENKKPQKAKSLTYSIFQGNLIRDSHFSQLWACKVSVRTVSINGENEGKRFIEMPYTPI